MPDVTGTLVHRAMVGSEILPAGPAIIESGKALDSLIAMGVFVPDGAKPKNDAEAKAIAKAEAANAKVEAEAEAARLRAEGSAVKV